LLKYITRLKRSTKGTIFRLGEINTSVGINADVDDLKIYDIALTDEQVAESYNSSKPLIVAAEVTAAPKAKGTVVKSKTAKTPSSNIIVNKDVNVGGKNIEVYSQGQKVVGDNSMTINDLPEGTYLLKISNAPSKKITSK
jgi:hypothetical protein